MFSAEYSFSEKSCQEEEKLKFISKGIWSKIKTNKRILTTKAETPSGSERRLSKERSQRAVLCPLLLLEVETEEDETPVEPEEETPEMSIQRKV